MPNLLQFHCSNLRSKGLRYCESLKPISRLTQLEFLSLPGVPFTAESVASWKSLTKLEWLVANTDGCTFDDGLESLPVFPSLHTLDIHLRTLTPAAADYLVTLPNLRTLILHDHDDSPQHFSVGMTAGTWNYVDPMRSTSKEAFETLAKSTSLECVYVTGREFGGLEDFAKHCLPNVEVRPLAVSHKQSTALLTAVFGAACWALIPGFAVLGQFSRPESLLTPNYKQPHLAHARLCIVAAITVGVAIAELKHVAWPVALATILGVVGFVVFSARPKQAQWMLVFAFIGPLQFLLGTNATSIWLRDYFAGEHGWAVAFAMAAVGLSLLVLWSRDVVNSHRTHAEQAMHRPVFTMQDWGLLGHAKLVNKDQTPWILKSMVAPADREVRESIQNSSRSNPIARRRLLAAPSYVPTTWILVLFVFANLVILGQRYFRTGTTAIEDAVSAMVIF